MPVSVQIGALDVDWRQRLQGEELLQLRLQQLQFERKRSLLEAALRDKVRQPKPEESPRVPGCS